MVAVLLQERGQVDAVRLLALQNGAQQAGHASIHPQTQVLGIEEQQRLHAENPAGALRLLLADSHDLCLPTIALWFRHASVRRTVSAIGEKDDRDLRSCLHMSRDGPAAPQSLIVHVRCQHHDFAAAGLRYRRLLRKDGGVSDQGAKALYVPPPERRMHQSLEQAVHRIANLAYRDTVTASSSLSESDHPSPATPANRTRVGRDATIAGIGRGVSSGSMSNTAAAQTRTARDNVRG